LEDFNTQKAYDIKILETIVIRVCDYKQYPKITNQRAPFNFHSGEDKSLKKKKCD
jgi:hypothetical protein